MWVEVVTRLGWARVCAEPWDFIVKLWVLVLSIMLTLVMKVLTRYRARLGG